MNKKIFYVLGIVFVVGSAFLLFSLETKAISVRVTYPTALNPGTVGIVYPPIQFLAEGGSGDYTWRQFFKPGVTDTPLSSIGLSLSSSGVLSGTPKLPNGVTSHTARFTVEAKDEDGTPGYGSYTVLINSAGQQTPTATPQIFTKSLPGGVMGKLYTFQLDPKGKESPFFFAWSKGAGFPNWLSLTPEGLLTGTPNAADNYNIPLTIKDQSGTKSDSRNFPMAVGSSATLKVSPQSLPTATLNKEYSQFLTVTGGAPPYKWSVFLRPSGLNYTLQGVNSEILQLKGALSESGDNPVGITVEDSAIPANSFSQVYPIKASLAAVSPPPGAGGGAGGVGRDCPKQYPQGQGMKNPRIYYSANKTPIAYDGLVPCGKCAVVNPTVDSKNKITTGGSPQYTPCQFCHFFVMFKGIVDWVVGGLVPILAILMLVIGGVMFYLGGANPAFLQTGKNIIKSVVWGLIIVFGAFLIVNTILAAIGLADFKAQGFDPRNWFQFPCQIDLTTK